MYYSTFYMPIKTDVLTICKDILEKSGLRSVACSQSADCLILPVPTPSDVVLTPEDQQLVIGGNLNMAHSKSIDLLKDPIFTAKNGAITADASLSMILSCLSDNTDQTQILVLGWGRIGKCLASKLHAIGCQVSVYARNPKDQAALLSLGYSIFSLNQISKYDCIINTIPETIFSSDDLNNIKSSCRLFEMASGKYLPGPHVMPLRGLPGICRPTASGKLIAETVIRLLEKEGEP